MSASCVTSPHISAQHNQHSLSSPPNSDHHTTPRIVVELCPPRIDTSQNLKRSCALFFVQIYHLQTPSSINALSIVPSHPCIIIPQTLPRKQNPFSVASPAGKKIISKSFARNQPKDQKKIPKTNRHEIHQHSPRPCSALHHHGRRRRQSELDEPGRLLVSKLSLSLFSFFLYRKKEV